MHHLPQQAPYAWGRIKKGSSSNIALIYDVVSNSWNEYSQFEHARSLCVVAVLPSDKLMILGGYVGGISPRKQAAVK